MTEEYEIALLAYNIINIKYRKKKERYQEN